jgi:DNA-binding NarL/FixJ family response regulator
VKQKTKILIAENETLLRESLEITINEQEDMETIGVASDATDAPELCRELSPDLVLISVVTEKNTNGMSACAKIRKEFPEIKIVVLTSRPENDVIKEATKAGAHSFFDKHVGIDDLLYTLRCTMSGMGVCIVRTG